MPQKSGIKSVKGCVACAMGKMSSTAPIHSCHKFERLSSIVNRFMSSLKVPKEFDYHMTENTVFSYIYIWYKDTFENAGSGSNFILLSLKKPHPKQKTKPTKTKKQNQSPSKKQTHTKKQTTKKKPHLWILWAISTDLLLLQIFIPAPTIFRLLKTPVLRWQDQVSKPAMLYFSGLYTLRIYTVKTKSPKSNYCLQALSRSISLLQNFNWNSIRDSRYPLP